jgi:NADH:ubiquinone oxidoreductase subunit 6 (subunit J)
MKQKTLQTTNLLAKFLILIILISTQGVRADLDDTVSQADKEKFDQMLTPLYKIYHFMIQFISVAAVMALVAAGIIFALSGNDVGRRENAKMWMASIAFGLIIIWGAPYAVDILTT